MDHPVAGKQSAWPIGGLKVYLYCLYSGVALLFLGVMRLQQGLEGSGAVLVGVGVIPFLTASVIGFVRLYQIWRLIVAVSPSVGHTPSTRSPGRAVGYLFIPLFNFYWMFVALGKLPRDLNAVARTTGTSSRVPPGLGLAAAVLGVVSVIPVLGLVTGAVNGLILIPLLLAEAVKLGKEVARIIATAEKLEGVTPALEETPDIRNLPELMNPENYGIRLGAGLAFPASKLSGFLFLMLASAPFGYLAHGMFFRIALGQLVIGVLTGVLFVIAGSLVRKTWLLPPVWGLLAILMGIAGQYIHGYFSAALDQPEKIQVAFNPGAMSTNFLWGFLFMSALILALRFWGLKIWSLPAGFLIFNLLASLPGWLIHPQRFFRFNSFTLLIRFLPFLELALLGLLLYLALRPPVVYAKERTRTG
jgi:hypothetical protein